jgi:hypothetical protein
MPRRKSPREAGQFKTTLADALANCRKSLEAFGRDSRVPVSSIVISSNVSLGESKPGDPGIAIWFIWDGAQMCVAVDRYATPAANLQAIYHVIEARRVELRHGTLSLVRATFQGFKALPPPPHWADVLQAGRDASVEVIERNYRRLAKDCHPDRGGSEAAMAELNAARDRALKDCAR